MPAIDITNPDVVKFLVESYDKTVRLRMRWNDTYAKGLQEASKLSREEKGHRDTDILKEMMVEGLSALKRDAITGARNKRTTPIRDGSSIYRVADLKKGHTIVDVGLGTTEEDPRLGRPDTDTTKDPVMRPVPPKQKKILYKDVPVFGREVYLKSRYKMAPEDKFYFMETSGWEYGWRLKDSFFHRSAPMYGRRTLQTKGTLSRSGPQPDPDHYKPLITFGPTKCTPL